ncbi:glycoside hydrolase [Penicillium angulare]|uniref:Glycoside hydrolase n=1 Tax=Penicillium angulare TaxID=116970 RepID=A0A9W9K1L7_9EURO|nr:glycoside hydrolase [Penicillium angulare]
MESGATKGQCTDTAGYISNYELYNLIIASQNPEYNGNVTIQQYEDEGDVLIYDKNWVSWLSPEGYVKRRDQADTLNFAGTSDWAVDLNQTYLDGGDGDEASSPLDDDSHLCDYSKVADYSTLDELWADAGDMQTKFPSVYTLQTLVTMLNIANDNYTNVNKGYDELFGYYVTYMEDLVPTVLDTELMMEGDGKTSGQSTFPIWGDGAKYFDCTYKGDTTNCAKFPDNELVSSHTDITLKVSDEDGWEKALADNGISTDYVVYTDYTRE